MLIIKEMTFNVQNQIFEIIFTEKGLRTGEVHLSRNSIEAKVIIINQPTQQFVIVFLTIIMPFLNITN